MQGEFRGEMENDHLRARIAWFYFVGGLTQQQIADRLNITRLRVNKTIGQIRSEGNVLVDLRLPLVECVDLEEKLKQKFALADASVTPSLPDYIEQQRAIGEAAGVMLDSLLHQYKGIGVGWGRTLSFSVRRITAKRPKDSWVVGLMGGVTRGSGTNTFEVSTALAQALDVECHYLTAPIYCPSLESRAALLMHEELAAVMRRAADAQLALVSCGDLSARSPITPITIVRDHLDELIARGSIGEVLGCFLDKDGEVIAHPVNDSIMALPLVKLKEKPASILASGGGNKVNIIRAILRGRYVNRLVTDEEVARQLLNDSGA
ncbi:sugar-binding transcriptional regulator [Affinibrenneria salicis]|uniref:Sugar-binding transcriptional regulator n=1 Tax=Affinibrenneria salicis TaxID=2590031 RepID=A0A5J5G3I0_9GAMM|nr:sugar-binding domain-containing protein [Affinibrenneria salicis]KAA9001282.1 sugar-binding transcriptional regulator [Affinibrenneria salicis]